MHLVAGEATVGGRPDLFNLLRTASADDGGGDGGVGERPSDGHDTGGDVVARTDGAQKFGEGGNMVNGDYDFSQDALNSPANVHRMKMYPLKPGTGLVADTYLVAVEEAGNGDYQDYVFVIGNVSIAP